jgi:predicted transcriptional regulator
MDLVRYVRGMGWTQEQLLVLVTGFAVFLLAAVLLRALKRFFGFDRVTALETEVARLRDEMSERVGGLEETLEDEDDGDLAVERCLEALRTGWPQQDSEVAKAAMGVLLQHAATHPDRYQGVWQALRAKVEALASDVVNDSAKDPETTRLIGLRAQQMLTDALSSMSEDPALRAAAERVIRGVLAKTEEALLQSPTAAMTTAMEIALKDTMQPWIDNDNDDDISEAATRLFRVVLNLMETRLSADTGRLSNEFDAALVERVKDLIGSDDEDLNEDIGELAEKIVATRGSALLGSDAASFSQVDETLVSKVVSYVEDDDLDEPVERLARAVVEKRVAALTTELPEALVVKVTEQVTSDVESWLDDNPDEVAPSVERLVKAVLDKEAKALIDAPPDGVVATVREKITDAVDDQLDELTDEICSAARGVAKAAIARSAQAS